MSMVQCPKGHFYNQQTNTSCPHCQGQGGLGSTVGLNPQQPNSDPWKNAGFDSTVPLQPPQVQPPQPVPFNKEALKNFKPQDSKDEGKTIGLYNKKGNGATHGIDPVVGWLVCIAGNDRGADFRIHPEKNTIGRSEGNDIRIAKDQTVSRENHATIVYDPKKKNFRILAGGGRGLVYVNDEVIDFSSPLKANDIIELGETKLMFVPLCGEHFDWDQVK